MEFCRRRNVVGGNGGYVCAMVQKGHEVSIAMFCQRERVVVGGVFVVNG